MSKNEEILAMIVNYIKKHGYSPTVEEIGKAVGLCSKSSTWYHLQQMFDAGIIETDHSGSPRAIRVPGYKFVKVEEERNRKIGCRKKKAEGGESR